MRASTAYAPCTNPTVHDPHVRNGVYCAGRTAPAPPVSVTASPPAVSEATGGRTSQFTPLAVLPDATSFGLTCQGSGGVASHAGVTPPAIDAVKLQAAINDMLERLESVRALLAGTVAVQHVAGDHQLACGCWASEANGRCLSEVTQ